MAVMALLEDRVAQEAAEETVLVELQTQAEAVVHQALKILAEMAEAELLYLNG